MPDLAMTGALLVSVAANIGLGLAVARIRLAPDPIAAAHERELARHADKIEHLSAAVRMHRASAGWLENELSRRLADERHRLALAEREIDRPCVLEETAEPLDPVGAGDLPALDRPPPGWPLPLSRAAAEAAR